jgi:YD repeat-containing protein
VDEGRSWATRTLTSFHTIYDNLYRLTQEQIASDPVSANNGTIGYSYDAVGNRLSRTSTGANVVLSHRTFENN